MKRTAQRVCAVDVSVAFGGQKKKVKLAAGATIKDAIAIVKANEQTVLVKLNGKVAHSRTPLRQGDKVELVGIIYSG